MPRVMMMRRLSILVLFGVLLWFFLVALFNPSHAGPTVPKGREVLPTRAHETAPSLLGEGARATSLPREVTFETQGTPLPTRQGGLLPDPQEHAQKQGGEHHDEHDKHHDEHEDQEGENDGEGGGEGEAPPRPSRPQQDEEQRSRSLKAISVLKQTEPLTPDSTRPKDFNICKGRCERYLAMTSNHGARFGHYFETWSGSFKLAHLMNLTFLHHDFAPKNMISARTWEKFLGLGQDYENYSSICVNRTMERFSALGYLAEECLEFEPCLEVVRIPPFKETRHDKDKVKEDMQPYLDEHPGCNVVFHLAGDQRLPLRLSPEEFPQGFDNYVMASYQEARRRYPIHCYLDPSLFNIAVHIRRGDVSSTRNTVGRYVPNEAFPPLFERLISLLERLRALQRLGRRGYAIHIYSEGEEQDFGPIQGFPSVQFHLNDDLFETLHHLALGDVFVGSNSGFSAFAAKIARGIRVFPFDNASTVRLSLQDSSFDEPRFEELFEELLPALRQTTCTRIQ